MNVSPFAISAQEHTVHSTYCTSGAAKNRMLEQKRFFHARMTPSQSLMATDGALKLNYASVIFVDPGVQIDEK